MKIHRAIMSRCSAPIELRAIPTDANDCAFRQVTRRAVQAVARDVMNVDRAGTLRKIPPAEHFSRKVSWCVRPVQLTNVVIAKRPLRNSQTVKFAVESI